MTLDLPTALPHDAYKYGERASGETHGVVLTKPHVVKLILDLAGYVADRNLAATSLLEPSCGHGAFVVEAVERLMLSVKNFNRKVVELDGAISGFDIDPRHVDLTRDAIVQVLKRYGVTSAAARALSKRWIVCSDFLLAPIHDRFDFVVGNPPYVRIEQLSPALQEKYRRRYVSIYDRADLYVAFIERGLNLLKSAGVLSFICADRWILNRYGAPLRRLLSEKFNVRCYLDLHRASPFDSEVIAYPSIFAISPGVTSRVHVGVLETADADECMVVQSLLAGSESAKRQGVTMSVYESWFEGEEPWVISTPAHLEVLRKLENRFHPIEYTARVGIGVATGNDKVYIVQNGIDIEPSRLVPLVMRDDIEKGKIRNSHRCVINTFDRGGVVNLKEYPKLERYIELHSADIQKRHVAKKNPGSWFRTIDRVYPDLVRVPKLLIPDIAGSNEVVFDEGHYHPHHNLYFVTSEVWDMEVLGGLLSSKVALFFVWSYAVKMRGGYLRFQAQYLRRIRLPDPKSLSAALTSSIRTAFRAREFAKLDDLACEAYGISGLPEFDFVDTRK